MKTELDRKQAWKKVIHRLSVEHFAEISERIQTRELQGVKISEVLYFYAEKIEDELRSKENERIERLPMPITLVVIFFFLGSMILIMGAILFTKLLDVLQTVLTYL